MIRGKRIHELSVIKLIFHSFVVCTPPARLSLPSGAILNTRNSYLSAFEHMGTGRDGSLGHGLAREGDEAKAAGDACLAVTNHLPPSKIGRVKMYSS